MGRSLECAVVAVALQILASGFAAGAVYGLVAAGQSIVFRLTGVVNFAFGELIALGVFMTLLVAAARDRSPRRASAAAGSCSRWPSGCS